jgi:hypothetical protein
VPFGVTGHRPKRPRGQVGPPGPHTTEPRAAQFPPGPHMTLRMGLLVTS